MLITAATAIGAGELMQRFTHFELTGIETKNEAAGPDWLPDISDLRERLKFVPNEGWVQISGQRLLMINSASFVALRRELFEAVGPSTTRSIMFQIGHAAGSSEARIAWEIRKDRPQIDAFMVGPQLHALRGEVHVEPVEIHADVETGKYYSELIWRNSAEAEAHIIAIGGSSEPVCWMQLGYASGYTSVIMERSIIFRETACAACGDAACRIVGRPAEEWDKADLKGFERFTSKKRISSSGSQRHPHLNGQVPADLVGTSPRFLAAWHQAIKAAPRKTTILLLGETGVGKEIFARNIHLRSPRAAKELFSLNCAAIPETLTETELFGVERGAYTGAAASRAGWFEAADGTTLFLDEVGSLPMSSQAKLLRVLQSGTVTRVGSTKTRKVDVRVICATNEDLEEKVKQGQFREDLLFRLNVFPVRIPPLRERREDLPFLIEHFLQRSSASPDSTLPGITEEAISTLAHYDFPGNVRELENMIERASILAEAGEPLTTFHLFSPTVRNNLATDPLPRMSRFDSSILTSDQRLDNDDLDLQSIEARAVERAMAKADGNVAKAARLLGVTRSKLRYYLKR